MATQPATCPYCAAPTFGMRFCTNCGAALHTAIAQPGVVCPNCGAPSLGMQFCTNCGIRLTTQPPPPQAPSAPVAEAAPVARKEVKAARKYAALRVITTIYRVLGWILLIGGSLLSIAAGIVMGTGTELLGQNLPQFSLTGTEAIVAAVGGVILSVLTGLVALAFADVCSVLMDIEANTRVQAESCTGGTPMPQ